MSAPRAWSPAAPLPAGWQWQRLKFLARVQTGMAKGKDMVGTETVEVPYLRVANVQDGYLDLDDVATMAVPVADLPRYRLQPGDVLMNEGGDFDKLGRGHVWHGQIDPCIHQNHVFAVRPHAVSPEWLNAYTGSAPAQFYFMGQAKQSTNLASISSTNLMELPVPLPPEPVQRWLLARIDTETARIDALIDKKTRFIELLREKRQALITQAVTRGTDPSVLMKESGVQWLGQIPSTWGVVQLGRVCWKVADGPHFSPEYVDDGVLFLSARNVRPGGWSLDDAKFVTEEDYREFCRRVVPELGDVLYTKGGTTGIAKVVDLQLRFQVWVHVAVLKLRRELVEPKFLELALNSRPGFEQSQLLTQGATNNDLGLTRMIRIWLALPPISTQRQIIEEVEASVGRIDSLIAASDRSVQLLRERRAALITAAVTGQIDVRAEVPEEQAEPA